MSSDFFICSSLSIASSTGSIHDVFLSFRYNSYFHLVPCQREWSIQSEAPKSLMLKNAKKRHTNWRNYLTTKYVTKGLTPFEKYKNPDSNHWEEFVKQRSGKEFEEKSQMQQEVQRRTNLTRLGCVGVVALTPGLENIPQTHVFFLKDTKDFRSKRYSVSRAKRNRTIKVYSLPKSTIAESTQLVDLKKRMIDDGSYFSGKEDPLTGLPEPECGGRARTVSNIIGHTKVSTTHNKVPTTQNNVSTDGSHIQSPSIECTQQEGSWECGYLVIRNMFDFVTIRQYEFLSNIRNNTTYVTEEEINKLARNIMRRFYQVIV